MQHLSPSARLCVLLLIVLAYVIGHIVGASGQVKPELDGEVVGAALIGSCMTQRGLTQPECAQQIMYAISGDN